MNKTPVKYTWQGFFQYSTSGRATSPSWRFYQGNAWKQEHTLYHGWQLSDRAKKILATWGEVTSTLTALSGKPLDEPNFLKWLAADPPHDAPQVTQGVAVMLNNIVAHGTVEPFKILASFVHGHLTVEMKKLPVGSPGWFYLRLNHNLVLLEEYLLMVPEWFYNVKSTRPGEFLIELKSSTELAQALQLLQAVRILHEHSVLQYIHDGDDLKICLRDEVTIVEYPKGRICCALPIPGKPITDKWKGTEPASVLTPEVVIASPTVETCLESLTRIWQDRFAKSVLISAPPGSGKEAYATSIPFGNGRALDHLLSIPLASGDTSSLERQLFGQRRGDGSIEDGIIAKAANTAVFFDEVHQPTDKAGIRASLLRPLEADEYFPALANKAERVDNVLFVLATSKSLEELGGIPPPDFWTRMTHVIAIKHPLDYDETEAGVPRYSQVLQYFFKCFWWDRLEKFFKIDAARITGGCEHAAIWLKEQQVRLLLDETTLNTVAGDFAEHLLATLDHKGRWPKEFSVRGIRSIVSRMFSMAVSDITRGELEWQKHFKNYLDSVIEEIYVVALLGDKSPIARIKAPAPRPRKRAVKKSDPSSS